MDPVHGVLDQIERGAPDDEASARAYDAKALDGSPDLELAGYTAAGLWLATAALLGSAALPQAHRPSVLALVVIAGVAVAIGLALAGLTAARRLGLLAHFAGNLAGVGLVAALVATSGEAHSIYAMLYLLPVVHAAAFQPRARLAVVVAAAAVAFLAPVVYGHPGSWFTAVAVVSMPPVILAAVGIAVVAALERRQRLLLLTRATEARRLAENDALTGLGNYRMFWRNLDAEVARSRRHGDPFSLVILDLNGFKAINDELGHQMGDRALRLVAGALVGALRGEDVCCRQGGDEFAVIAVRAEEREAEELAERLTAAVASIRVPGAEHRRLGASAGWATFGRPATTADELILSADEALREAKRHRRLAAAARRPPDVPAPELADPHAAPAERGTPPVFDESAARLVVLSGYGRALAGARDERGVAETTVAHLAGAVDAAATTVLRVDPDTGAMRLLAAAGEGGVPHQNGSATAARPVAALALRERRAATSDDARERGHGEELGPRMEVAVPILVQGEVWGCLVAESGRPAALRPSEREVMEQMATQMARALACVRVLDRLSDTDFGELYRLAADVETTRGESWRIADLAWQVGRRLGFTPAGLRALYLAALFHDVGSVGVPAEVIGKRGQLNDAERAVLNETPVIGERIMRPQPLLREASSIILHAHERFDGTGYPDGLAGDAIPLAARVLLACDTWVAMTSQRPWRSARPVEHAREELRRVAGAQLDPDVVEALVGVLEAEREATPAPR